MTPTPTPAQAVRVLEILEAWLARGWYYAASDTMAGTIMVEYTNPEKPLPISDNLLESEGDNHFDALCQATTVMQVLLAEHPEKG